MCLIAPHFAVEIHCRIARVIHRRLFASIVLLKALQLALASGNVPSTVKWSSDIRPNSRRLGYHTAEELSRHFSLQQPVAILAVDRWVPHGVVHV